MEELTQLKQPIDPIRIPMSTQNFHPINNSSNRLDQSGPQVYGQSITPQSRAFHSDGCVTGVASSAIKCSWPPSTTQNFHPINNSSNRLDQSGPQFYGQSITHQSRAFHSDGCVVSAASSAIKYFWPPSTTHEKGEVQKEIQDLYSTLTSELGSAKSEELSGGSVLNNQGFGIGSAFSLFGSKNFVADHLNGQGHMRYMEIGKYYRFSNSRYVKAAQELLDEICCVGRAQFEGISRLTKNHNSNTDGAGITFASSVRLLPAPKSEYQRRKVKLLAMLDELEERYRHYHENMQAMVNSFESVIGIGSARAYTALARQAMSRHFRCLKDAMTAQLKLNCERLGEKDVDGNSRLTKGMTLRRRANLMGVTEAGKRYPFSPPLSKGKALRLRANLMDVIEEARRRHAFAPPFCQAKGPRLRANLMGVIEEAKRRWQGRAILGSASTLPSTTGAVAGADGNDNEGTTKDFSDLNQTSKQPRQGWLVN